MELEILHDKQIIYNALKNDLENQIFCIGDLDDFYWTKTICYSLKVEGEIKSIAILYIGSEIPTLLLFENESLNLGELLMQKLTCLLPQKFYAHLNQNILTVFGIENIIENYGSSLKMALKKKLDNPNDENIRVLEAKDISAIQDFLAIAYPQNWFDPRMVSTGKYFGYFEENNLIGIAGIHVFSKQFKVAALGNIATHPDFRGRNIATKLISALCYNLQNEVDTISLNVRAENKAAINCYIKMGFEITGEYEECLLQNGK